MCVFYKLTDLKGKNSWLRAYVANIKGLKGDFFFKLIECEFCMESHIGLLMSLPLCYYFEEPSLFLFGWASAALSNIIKTISPK